MENITKEHRVVSLKAPNVKYNLGYGDRRYRFKERIEKQFPDDILFLTLPLPNSSSIVIRCATLEEKPLTQCFTENTAVKYAAKTMKNDMHHRQFTPFSNIFKT